MGSVLNINGNMFLKHSVFRGGLSAGPLPSLYQMNVFLFALYAYSEALFLLGDWVITFLI